MTIPEQRLWQAVLIQAINDAVRENPYSPEDRRAKSAAIAWLDRGKEDFREACFLAGFDPDHVRESWRSGRLTHISSKLVNEGRGDRYRVRKSRSKRAGINGRQVAAAAPLPVGF